MSEPEAAYVSPTRGEDATAAEGCSVCGSPGVHIGAPMIVCVRYLRAELGTLQGEMLALRLQLAARPEPTCLALTADGTRRNRGRR